jgi:asparagine synthase (glutamine-hydrolysing)
MCGISGFLSTLAINPHVIDEMTDALTHRGPDGRGTFFSSINNVNCGLGHRRLSIIDLSDNGSQPMIDKSGNYVITFNGEIYNYLEIKHDLEILGYSFKSESDTEILLYALIEFGTSILNRLNGMFVFAFLNIKANELIIARDRFGQKPLFYSYDKENLCFASELKSLFKHPSIDKKLDRKSLIRYLCYEYSHAPHSLIKNIRKLNPGHFAILDFKKNFEFRIKKYWDVNLTADYDLNDIPEEELCSTLLEKLRESISKRMMSDVPLGVFLSGGVDSSSIVALLHEIMDTSKLSTFSIGFKEASFDESEQANLVARIFRTNHHQKLLKAADLLDYIPEIMQNLDEPMADASIIPTYVLSKFTREHVTVALGGDGGDELFAGYDPFLAHFWANKAEYLPKALLNSFSKLASYIPVSDKNMSLDFKIKHFLSGLNFPILERNQRWMGAFSPDNFSGLFTESFADFTKGIDPYYFLKTIKRSDNDYIANVAKAYQKTYLPDDILVKIDRASMMNSLEARSPFLDVEFAEFANSLPSHFKFRGTTRKYILKKALENKLPNSIIYRKKKGFGIPLTKWIREDLRAELYSTFNSSVLVQQEIIEPNYYKTLMDQHLNKISDNRKPIWTLYVLEKWLKLNNIS